MTELGQSARGKELMVLVGMDGNEEKESTETQGGDQARRTEAAVDGSPKVACSVLLLLPYPSLFLDILLHSLAFSVCS